MMNRKPAFLVIAIAASTLAACAAQTSDDEDIRQSTQALNPIYMTTSGDIKSTNPAYYPGVGSTDIYYAAEGSTWAAANPDRFQIIDLTDLENAWSVPNPICGDTARAKYGAKAGAAWCTEYARWIYKTSGSRNIRYCEDSFLGRCTDYRYLSQATTVTHMRKLFKAAGGWVTQADVDGSTIQPGDYLALSNSNGDSQHSGVVMAVTADSRWVYTSEGNVNNCVKFMLRDYMVDGKLNPDIDGVGKINVTF